jgi:para-nitrobenzyl esterase
MKDNQVTRRQAIAGALGTGILLSSSTLSAQQPGPSNVVETAAGKIRGTRARGVSRFLGVPYGIDTSTCRFQPAQPAQPWSGVRECIAIGPQAPQMQINASGMTGGEIDMNSEFVKQVMMRFREGMEVGNESESCLVLNVYTPDASPRRKRPVMVWLHGGGFSIGSAGDPQYDGSAVARRGDVVVVGINHRLNALGYLYLGDVHNDFADSGMVGQLDIVLALKWVRDNIAMFGGDAGNVTIFGQSGGGAKVSTLLAMPPAKGLFHKAIVQSGPALMAVDKSRAADQADRLLAKLGVPKADVHKLQKLDCQTLLAAASSPEARGPLSPVVDGRSLPAHPFTPSAPEVSRDVPIMIGSTHDESTLFMSADPLFGKMTDEQACGRMVAILKDKGLAAFELYKSVRPGDPPTYWMTSLMTDMRTWMDSIRLAERKLAQRAAPVFMYRLDWRTPILGGAMRSPHGLDVPLVFDTVETRRGILGSGPEPQRLADVMSQAWINFARTADPSQARLSWTQYETTARNTMIFDTASRVVADPDRDLRLFWS